MQCREDTMHHGISGLTGVRVNKAKTDPFRLHFPLLPLVQSKYSEQVETAAARWDSK